MYRITIRTEDDINGYRELAKVFLRPEEFTISTEGEGDLVLTPGGDRNGCKRSIFEYLSGVTGRRPAWGILTGVRPVKLFGDLAGELGTEGAIREFRETYLVSAEKTELTARVYDVQRERFGEAPPRSAGVYAGIPFCPTRCLYCSFASNPVTGSDVAGYLGALEKEISAAACLMEENGIYAETIYLGGGTPTSIDAADLDRLMGLLSARMGSGALREFTLEAGRPDTIDEEKLRIAKGYGARRISINPQSMKEETLKAIGRDHTPDDIRRAFEMAKKAGIPVINADVIAGLPGEGPEDMEETLKEITELGAENITVHSLAVKRASRLKEADPEYHYKKEETVTGMLGLASGMLMERGYRPYYLYRQKHMSGALENVGYARPGTEGLYNVRIMDEHQTIVALGAGGISKAYDPSTRSFTRVPNVKDYKTYIERIDEMIRRKRDHLFREEDHAD